MDCTKITKLLSAYVDQETNRLESDVVSEHVKKCGVCRQRLSELYTLNSMVQDSYGETEDIDVSAAVMSRISAGRPQDIRDFKKKKLSSVFYKSVAAALVLAAVSVFAVSMHKGNEAEFAQGNLERLVDEHVDGVRHFEIDGGNLANVQYEQ